MRLVGGTLGGIGQGIAQEAVEQHPEREGVSLQRVVGPRLVHGELHVRSRVGRRARQGLGRGILSEELGLAVVANLDAKSGSVLQQAVLHLQVTVGNPPPMAVEDSLGDLPEKGPRIGLAEGPPAPHDGVEEVPAPQQLVEEVELVRPPGEEDLVQEDNVRVPAQRLQHLRLPQQPRNHHLQGAAQEHNEALRINDLHRKLLCCRGGLRWLRQRSGAPRLRCRCRTAVHAAEAALSQQLVEGEAALAVAKGSARLLDQHPHGKLRPRGGRSGCGGLHPI
mmetsp:Transcript_42924/g.128240  ORF Transcript_42924/g.128240 Transcript_42924/m.128240 type:complete len:279 (-) Transcript_42924:119-955(-)